MRIRAAAAPTTLTPADKFARLIGTYADQSTPAEDAAPASDAPEQDDSIVFPEDFSTLSTDDIESLRQKALAGFDTVYGDGENLSEEALATLSGLTEGIEALGAEIAQRQEAGRTRREAAEALAARVRSGDQNSAVTDDGEDDEDETPADEDAPDEDEEEVEEPATDAGAAAAETLAPRRRAEYRVPGLRSNLPAERSTAQDGRATTMRDIVHAAGEGTGFAAGTGLDWGGIGKAVDKRLASFNQSQYQTAAQRGQHLRQQFSVATIEKPMDKDLIVQSSDPAHIDEVISRATSEKNLPGNSLVAAGGWCAPSETLYDLLEIESRDGLFDLPSIGISRGGINHTLGPDFADIFASDIGFHYTEAEDIAGDYDGAGGGSKPCYRIECAPFEEARLEVDGVCVSAGLLMQRGYPELIARTTRGVLVAHDHKQAALRINTVVAGSDAVTMPTLNAGTTAPLLSAIELQIEHMRYVRRLSRSTTMEAVFPFWVHASIRADLALRQGVDMLSVTNAQINAWFAERGARAQFVYNWQDLTGDASDMTALPDSVQFLLYPAGTWLAAGENIISLDTLYDSVLLGQNDFTALFTEESWLVLKRGFDSRVVTVPLCSSGMTNAGAILDCDGSYTAPAAG